MPLRRVFLPVSPMVRVLNLSHSTHGTLWKLSREAKNKKSIQLATFLRLGIVACLPNRRLKRKNADNLLFGSPIPLCGDRRESLIEKKLQRSRNFCFYKGRTDPAGQTLRKTRGEQQILRKTRGIAVTATRQVSARKISGSSPSSRYCPSFLAIQTRGFRL